MSKFYSAQPLGYAGHKGNPCNPDRPINNLILVEINFSKDSDYDIHLNVDNFYTSVKSFKVNKDFKKYLLIGVPLIVIFTGLCFWKSKSIE